MPSRPTRKVPRTGAPVVLVEHAVGAGDLAVRPVVGQQGEEVALDVGPGAQAEHRVARDADDLEVVGHEPLEVVADLVELAGADAREGEGVEDDDDVLLGASARQRDLDAVLVAQG